MKHILLGISAWADRELIESGRFYPPDVKTPWERLRYYAREFSIAEIDSSYHFFPTRRNMDLWLENTPPGFVFDIRAFSLFTGHPTPWTSLPRTIREGMGDPSEHRERLYLHHLPDEIVDALWRIFAGALGSFDAAGKLGAVLFQFPPWFHPREENYRYLSSCRERLPQYRLAMEFRVGSWLNEEHREQTLTLLRKQQIALVCVDEPQGLRSSVPPSAEVTAPLGVVRFHGRNRENWERKDISTSERFSYLYSLDELKEWEPGIRLMVENVDAVHVIFKNKSQDFPIRNARQMRQLLDEDS
jgi:uncharacterized protein YecE (DUF72 family)